MLCVPLAGQNHLFLHKKLVLSSFSVTNGKKERKKKESMFLLFFAFLQLDRKDGKNLFYRQKMISTSQWCAEHSFIGQNTQQIV